MGSSRDEILHDTKESSRLVSSNTKTTASIPDALSVLLPSNNVPLKSNDKVKCTNGKKIVKDGNEITNKKAITPIGEIHVVLPSALFGQENNTVKSKICSSVTAVNNMFDAEKLVVKKVRSDSEGNKTSPLSESKKKRKEVTEENPKILFSDEEDGGKECSNIDEDVSRSISRIQNLLRGDRLRTNRKRKHPVVWRAKKKTLFKCNDIFPFVYLESTNLSRHQLCSIFIPKITKLFNWRVTRNAR